MLDIGFLFLAGMGISTMLVRRSSRKGMGIELTWLQAFKVVTFRAGAGILTGFVVGRLVGLAIGSGWLTLEALKTNAWYLIASRMPVCYSLTADLSSCYAEHAS